MSRAGAEQGFVNGHVVLCGSIFKLIHPPLREPCVWPGCQEARGFGPSRILMLFFTSRRGEVNRTALFLGILRTLVGSENTGDRAESLAVPHAAR